MEKHKREELRIMVKQLTLQGLPDSDIIIMLVMRAPLNFSHAGAVKFIKWARETS